MSHALTLNILTISISLHSDIYMHLPSNIWFQLSASADDGKAGCMNAKTQSGNAGLLTSCHQRVLDVALTAQLKHIAIHSPSSPSSAFTIFANRKPQVPLEGAACQKLLCFIYFCNLDAYVSEPTAIGNLEAPVFIHFQAYTQPCCLMNSLKESKHSEFLTDSHQEAEPKGQKTFHMIDRYCTVHST